MVTILCLSYLPTQVLTVTMFQGGGAFNVIPDKVTIGGTFRAFSKERLEQLAQRIEQVCYGEVLLHNFSK